MAINFKLAERFDIEDHENDPMGRRWVGWDDNASLDDLFDLNRGVWRIGKRVERERYATFSHNGVIKMVAEISGTEHYSFTDGSPPKTAVVGRVIRDPDVLAGFRRVTVDTHRNPVTYLPDPDAGPRVCACGCGSPVVGSRAWHPGHDQRAVHKRITERWGGTLGFIRWYDATYS